MPPALQLGAAALPPGAALVSVPSTAPRPEGTPRWPGDACFETVTVLLRDAASTPLAVLARLATTGREAYALVSLTVNWQAERQSWAEEVETHAAVTDHLAEVHRQLFRGL